MGVRNEAPAAAMLQVKAAGNSYSPQIGSSSWLGANRPTGVGEHGIGERAPPGTWEISALPPVMAVPRSEAQPKRRGMGAEKS